MKKRINDYMHKNSKGNKWCRSAGSLIPLIIILLIPPSSGIMSCKPENTVRIANQYGLAYAPLEIIHAQGLMEKELAANGLPEWNVEWKQLSNTAAIREAMSADQLDIGFMGIPPFLIGLDKGMAWGIFTGLSQAPLGLVTWKEEVKSIEDLTMNDRIALPQPGSIQHILLTMACGRTFGKTDIFDNQLSTMKHPDGMTALLARKDIAAHFTSPPFLMEELKQPGMHKILSGKEAFGGEFTFIVGTVTESFHSDHPAVIKALTTALDQAMKILETPERAAEILAENYQISNEMLIDYLNDPELIYSREIIGMDQFIQFMFDEEYIQTIPGKPVFPQQ